MEMTQEELIALARAMAKKHGLDPALVCAICEQESDPDGSGPKPWNPWAMRYEAAFFRKYVAPLFTAGKIGVTEAWARAFSWGLMQVMGQTAREHGFDGKFVSELCDPAVGLEIGCHILVHKLAVKHGEVGAALLAWNGGANASYDDQVLARVARYQG
jgi:soluble lytic murein transglycosylase-like protein